MAYCYELQLEAAAQRKGLGKHLMALLELMVGRVGGGGRAALCVHNRRGAVCWRRGHRTRAPCSRPPRRRAAAQSARFGMAGVLLTVMRANGGALSFYGRLGYREHESSPGADGEEAPAGYVILGKQLGRRPAAGHSHSHGGGCCGGHDHHHHH